MNFADLPSPAAPAAAQPAKAEPAKAPESAPVAANDVGAPELKVGATEVVKEPVKRKYRVNDKDIELTDEESTAWVQKAIHADAQIKEATQLKKQTASLIEKLKTPQGLREILSDPAISLDRKQLAIEWVKEYMAEEALDPKDREIKATKAELEAYKSREAELKAKQEAESKQADMKKRADEFRSEIIGAMEAHAGVLPKSQAVMDRIIGYMRAGFRQTGKVLPAAEAVKYVLKDYEQEFSETTKSADVQRLIQLLGPDAIKKIREADLAKLKADLSPSAKAPEAPDLHKDIKKDKKGRISEKEFRNRIFGGL